MYVPSYCHCVPVSLTRLNCLFVISLQVFQISAFSVFLCSNDLFLILLFFPVYSKFLQLSSTMVFSYISKKRWREHKIRLFRVVSASKTIFSGWIIILIILPNTFIWPFYFCTFRFLHSQASYCLAFWNLWFIGKVHFRFCFDSFFLNVSLLLFLMYHFSVPDFFCILLSVFTPKLLISCKRKMFLPFLVWWRSLT